MAIVEKASSPIARTFAQAATSGMPMLRTPASRRVQSGAVVPRTCSPALYTKPNPEERGSPHSEA